LKSTNKTGALPPGVVSVPEGEKEQKKRWGAKHQEKEFFGKK